MGTGNYYVFELQSRDFRTAAEVGRGVNVVEVVAPAGTVLYSLELDARANRRGTRSGR